MFVGSAVMSLSSTARATTRSILSASLGCSTLWPSGLRLHHTGTIHLGPTRARRSATASAVTPCRAWGLSPPVLQQFDDRPPNHGQTISHHSRPTLLVRFCFPRSGKLAASDTCKGPNILTILHFAAWPTVGEPSFLPIDHAGRHFSSSASQTRELIFHSEDWATLCKGS
jgi:hypothetical protein